MYCKNITVLVLFGVFLIVTKDSACSPVSEVRVKSDDLLDEYVKYVEEHNALNPWHNQKFKNKAHGKHKRDVSYQNNDEETSSDLVWTHQEVLDPDTKFVLKWARRDKEMFFRVEANTKGYIGLGFSPNGNMKNADIVLAWFDDDIGQPILWDCHGSPDSNAAPIRDETENYNLLKGEQNGAQTIIEFSRPLDTCDDYDYIINTDTIRLIWALHELDPRLGAPLPYHGPEARGTVSLHLLAPTPISAPSPQDPHVRKWEVTLNNFVVPHNMDTMYWCKIFKPPTLQEKHHIIGYEPVVGTNHTSHAHHMLLYECELGNSPNINEWETYTKGAGSACYGPFMPRAWEVCLTPIVVWAVGSKGEFLPEHVGLPIAEKPNTYYMLEIHFDNPSMKRTVGTSGLKIHYTRRLRRHDAGVMVTGVTVTPLQVIPPKQPEYRSVGLCGGECTSSMFPERGINVISVLLHSHLAGKRLSLRHIRNEEELEKIVEDNHYDFDFQQSRMLKKERVIFPGDTLVTECVYQTKKRIRPTVGGYSTKQEMCLAFIMHYPRTQLAGCYSMSPIKQFFEIFGVHEFYDNDMKKVEEIFLGTLSDSSLVTPKPVPEKPPPLSFPRMLPGEEISFETHQRQIQAIQQAKWYTIDGDVTPLYGPLAQLIIKEPQEFQNKTFMSHLTEIPWEESLLTKRIEESFYKGQHLTFCRKRDDTLALPMAVQKFPNFITHESNATKRQCTSVMYQSSSETTHISTLTIVSTITSLIIQQIFNIN